MSTYTPGPWRVDVEDDDCGDTLVLRMGEALASPYAHDVAHAIRLYEDVSDEYADQYAEMTANARLIAAAPDLLAALKTLMDRGFTMATESLAARAIEKAQGRK